MRVERPSPLRARLDQSFHFSQGSLEPSPASYLISSSLILRFGTRDGRSATLLIRSAWSRKKGCESLIARVWRTGGAARRGHSSYIPFDHESINSVWWNMAVAGYRLDYRSQSCHVMSCRVVSLLMPPRKTCLLATMSGWDRLGSFTSQSTRLQFI